MPSLRRGAAAGCAAIALGIVVLGAPAGQASAPTACGTSEPQGYNDLHVTGVSCRTGTRLAIEWRRRAFGGAGRANVQVDAWRCRLTKERGEGSVVRCSRDDSLVAWYPAPPAAPVPGFQIDLAGAGGTHLECAVSGDRVRCLNYSRAKAPGRCDFGGDVPGVELPRRGQARLTYACVDEGFHGWERLRAGETFASGPFRCRATATRKTLRCATTASRASFQIDSNGRVHRMT